MEINNLALDLEKIERSYPENSIEYFRDKI